MPAPIFTAQSSFAGGEFSPSLYARVDIAKYLTGAKTIRNFNVLPHGGARNRAGTMMVASAGDSTHAVRLIPFVVATNQAFVIEVGNFYMRFYTAGAQIQGQSGPVQIATPYAAADIFNLKFAQSADVLFLAHSNYAPMQLTYSLSILNSNNPFTLSPYSFVNGPYQVANVNTSQTLTPSGTKMSATVNISSASKYLGAPTVVNPGPYFWNIINQYIQLTTATAHGLTAGMQTTISGMTGVLVSQLNGNTFYVSVPTPTTLKLFHDAALTSPVQYTGQYNGGGPAGSGVQGSAGNFTTYSPSGTVNVPVPLTLTSSFNLFQAGHVGALFQLQRTVVAQTISGTFTANNLTSTVIQCGSTYNIITLGGWTGKIIVQVSVDQVTWNPVQTLQGLTNTNYQLSGATGYSQCYLRVVGDNFAPAAGYTPVAWSGTLTYDLTANSFDWNANAQIISVTSPTVAMISVVTSTQNAWPIADTNSTYQWSEGSWSTFRGFPTCVTFYQDRLAWASTATEPQTVWFSQTASYSNFGVSEPVVATDSISAVLPGRQLNAIQSMIVMPQFMVALTSDSEWAINPASGSGAFTPSTININLQGHRGSAYIDPVAVGVELILIQQMGTVVRNLIFQLAVNGFLGDNLSIVSQHLFTGYTISQMAYQQEPDSVVWAVRSDGQLLSCTYMRDQEMNAWSHHDTQGSFESVCSIPNSSLGLNEVWFVVNRNSTRFIERLMPRDQGTNPASQFFVDCGLTYNGAPATVISGLGYLAGQTVSILADGNVIPQQVVSQAGTITLAVAASVVTVGLPYVCDLETLQIEAPDRQGTLQGRRVAIPEVTIRFWNSRGGYYKACSEDVEPPDNSTSNGFDEIVQRGPSDNWNAPIQLKTRDYKVSMDGGYDFGAHVFFRQVDPLPVCLLAFLPSVVAGEK